MRWKAAQRGDKRILKRFAWVPQKVGKNWIWLEAFYEEHVYSYTHWGLGWFIENRWLPDELP